MKRNGRLLAGLLLCLALIMAIFATGILNKQKVWPDVRLDYRNGQQKFDRQQGDAYGLVSSGPYYDLPAGVYRLKWQMEGDGENAIGITCSNDVEIVPARITTTAGEWQGEALFEIKGPAHNVSFNVEFCEGEKLSIYNFRLYSPEYRDHAFTAAAVILLAWALYACREKLKSQTARETLFVLLAAVTAASLPMLRENSLMAWDVQYHTLRIMNLADGLSAGQFPVRIGGFSYNGYGAVTSVFYPDLLLYPLALLVMGGASLSYVVNVAGIAVNALSAVTMYAAARRLLSDHKAALGAAVLFTLSSFRLFIEYDSFMLGYLLGMAFMPLFFAELWEVIFADRTRWVRLALYATLIFQSHLLSVVLCACAAAGICAVFLPVLIKEKRLTALFKAILLALLLNAYMLLPMALYYLGGVNTAAMQFGFAGSALEAYEVLMPSGRVGLALLLGLVLFLACAPEEGESRKIRLAAWVFAAAGGLCMLLSTDLTPWSHIVKLTGGAVEILQFPWRILGLAAVFLSFCGGYGYARVLKGQSLRAALFVLALAVVTACPWIELAFEEKGVLEFGQGANAYIVTPEYQIEGTDVNQTRSRAVLLEGDGQLTAYQKNGTQIEAQIEAAGDVSVSFPLFGFDGYAAEIDGVRTPWRLGENNRLTLDVPGGAVRSVRIWFEGKTIWYVTDAVSGLTMLGIIGYWLKKKRDLH